MASLKYSLRLQELVVGLFAISITTVILPVMSDQVVSKNTEGVKDTLRFATGLVGFVTVPASVGLWLLGEPIVSVCYLEFGAFDSGIRRRKPFPPCSCHRRRNFLYCLGRIMPGSGLLCPGRRENPDPRGRGGDGCDGMLWFRVGCTPRAGRESAPCGGTAALATSRVLWWMLGRKMGALVSSELMVGIVKTTVASPAMGSSSGRAEQTLPVPRLPGFPDSKWLATQVAAGIGVIFAVAKGLKSNELSEVVQVIRRRRIS